MTKILVDKAVLEQALEALKCVDLQSLVPDYGSGHYSVARLDGPQVKSAITVMEAALAEPVQEPVAFITPLMEQQMFDDWCPYKGSPDPRTVWAAAVDSVNGLLLGASPPQRKPLTEEEIDSIWDSEKAFADIYAITRAIERAHGIT